MIGQLSAEYPVEALCEVLGVSRSGYHAARVREPGARQRSNRALTGQIREVFARNRRVYGSIRVTEELKARGVKCSLNRVARLMRADGLAVEARRRFRPKAPARETDQPISPNRLPEWMAGTRGGRTAWVTDITYIETREGWLYLAALMDLETRKITGWSAQDHMREELVQAALDRALRQRRPGKDILHHSDRGSQYAARGYRGCLAAAGIETSMSAAGYCYDNAAMESFWATLKRELFGQRIPSTREEAKAMIFEYIEVFYNRQRRHSSLGYLSPLDYEIKLGYVTN
jgi:putative transposase